MLRLAVGLAFIVVPVLELALLIKTGQVMLRRARLRVEIYGAEADGPRESPHRPTGIGDGPIIEGEFERVDDNPPRPRRRAPPP
jgi:hypothetical protein